MRTEFVVGGHALQLSNETFERESPPGMDRPEELEEIVNMEGHMMDRFAAEVRV